MCWRSCNDQDYCLAVSLPSEGSPQSCWGAWDSAQSSRQAEDVGDAKDRWSYHYAARPAGAAGLPAVGPRAWLLLCDAAFSVISMRDWIVRHTDPGHRRITSLV